MPDPRDRDDRIADVVFDAGVMVQGLLQIAEEHQRLVIAHRTLRDAALAVYAGWASGALEPAALERLRAAVLPLLANRDGADDV
jgi:hypothetical protein